MTVKALTYDQFENYQFADLYSEDEINYRIYTVDKNLKLRDLKQLIAKNLQLPVRRIRIWEIIRRSNLTFHARYLDDRTEKNLIDFSTGNHTWSVYIQVDAPGLGLQEFNSQKDVLLFIKYYDFNKKILISCGEIIKPIKSKVDALVPVICEKLNLDEDTAFTFYEGIMRNAVDVIPCPDMSLDDSLDDTSSSSIIIVERKMKLDYVRNLMTVNEYLRAQVEPVVLRCYPVTADVFTSVEVAGQTLIRDAKLSIATALGRDVDSFSISNKHMELDDQKRILDYDLSVCADIDVVYK